MTERPVPELAAAASDVLAALRAAAVPACLIGGLAIQRWGQTRATADVDLSVLASYGDEPRIVDLLLKSFEARRAEARDFALLHRVLLIKAGNGVTVDVALAASPFEIEAIESASPWEVAPGLTVPTCSAEHLIVYKVVAGRPQDLVDIEGIVRRQHLKLDVERVRTWGALFAELKEDPDLLQPFERVWRQVRR